MGVADTVRSSVGRVAAGIAERAGSRVESIRSNRFDIVSRMDPGRQTRPPRRPTLRDVARRAGVSTSTASLVFSGKGPVASATAERVRTAAGDLAYAGPDPLASSLRQGRVGTVAVVVEGPLRYAFHDPFALAVLDGLAEELDAAGRTMLLVAQPARRPRPRGRPARHPGRRRCGVPPVRPPRQPPCRPPHGPRHPPRRQRCPGAPAGRARAHRRECGHGARGPARRWTSGTRASPTYHAAAAPSPTGWVTDEDVARRGIPRRRRAVGRASVRSPATMHPSSRRTTSPSRPARPPPGCSSTVPAATGPPPSWPRPTCWPPAWSAPRSSCASGCPRT